MEQGGIGLRGKLACVCIAAALAVLPACGDDPSEEGAPGGEVAAGEEHKPGKAPAPKSISDLKDYKCPGSIKLGAVVTATEITTVGVPCDEVAGVLSDNSRTGFTCFLTGTSARCSDGRKTIEYEQG